MNNRILAVEAHGMYELLKEYCTVVEDFVSRYDNFPEELCDIDSQAQEIIDRIESYEDDYDEEDEKGVVKERKKE